MTIYKSLKNIIIIYFYIFLYSRRDAGAQACDWKHDVVGSVPIWEND